MQVPVQNYGQFLSWLIHVAHPYCRYDTKLSDLERALDDALQVKVTIQFCYDSPSSLIISMQEKLKGDIADGEMILARSQAAEDQAKKELADVR